MKVFDIRDSSIEIQARAVDVPARVVSVEDSAVITGERGAKPT